jgi:hypothetical protein
MFIIARQSCKGTAALLKIKNAVRTGRTAE